VEPDQIISTIGTLLFAWATGVTIGPLFGAMAMAWLGPGGLFIYSALVCMLLTIFVVVRIRRQRREPVMGGFATIVPTSSAAATMTPRAEMDPTGGEAPSGAENVAPSGDDAAAPDQRSASEATATVETSS
jgi:hypothetical protein